jgi:SAM-dependent methyltransferase
LRLSPLLPACGLVLGMLKDFLSYRKNIAMLHMELDARPGRESPVRARTSDSGGIELTSEFPYAGFAEVYDEIMADAPYDLWLEYIESIWSTHGFMPVSVLDLACGTGNMSWRLARNGYLVTGLDRSEQMLEIARQKAKDEGLYIRFIKGNMEDFILERQLDAAVCLFDSLNYLLEPSDVRSCFKSVFNALNPGGCFMFDVNTRLRLSTVPDGTMVFEGPWYFVVWRNFWDGDNEWWQVNLTGFIKRNGVWQRFDEVHRERAFPVETLAVWLEEAGFEVKGIYDPPAFKPASESTLRAYFVARKPDS